MDGGGGGGGGGDGSLQQTKKGPWHISVDSPPGQRSMDVQSSAEIQSRAANDGTGNKIKLMKKIKNKKIANRNLVALLSSRENFNIFIFYRRKEF